jgi:hypothetical protein
MMMSNESQHLHGRCALMLEDNKYTVKDLKREEGRCQRGDLKFNKRTENDEGKEIAVILTINSSTNTPA